MAVRLSFGESVVHLNQSETANYPPLAMYIIYACGKIHRRLDPNIVANTPVARLVYQAAALIADILLALGTPNAPRQTAGFDAAISNVDTEASR